MLKRSNKRRVESAYNMQHHSVQPLHARHSLRSCHPGQASRSLYGSAALVRNSNSVGPWSHSIGLQSQRPACPRPAVAAAGSGDGPYTALPFVNFVTFSTKHGSTSDKACVRLVGSRYVYANAHHRPRSRFWVFAAQTSRLSFYIYID